MASFIRNWHYGWTTRCQCDNSGEIFASDVTDVQRTWTASSNYPLQLISSNASAIAWNRAHKNTNKMCSLTHTFEFWTLHEHHIYTWSISQMKQIDTFNLFIIPCQSMQWQRIKHIVPISMISDLFVRVFCCHFYLSPLCANHIQFISVLVILPGVFLCRNLYQSSIGCVDTTQRKKTGHATRKTHTYSKESQTYAHVALNSDHCTCIRGGEKQLDPVLYARYSKIV